MIRRFFPSTVRKEQESGGGSPLSSYYVEAEDADHYGIYWTEFEFVGAVGTTLSTTAGSPAPPSPVENLDWIIRFNIPVMESGTYKIYLRINVADSGRDSIHHRMDGSAWQANPSMFTTSTTLGWQVLEGPDGSDAQYVLNEGTHVFELHKRERAIVIDRIYFTKNGDLPI